jgi:hypothetical protein
MRKRLSISALKTILRYDARTGNFYWRVTRGWCAVKGTKAGTVTKSGYVHLHISGRIYKGHRLAWAFKRGRFPKHDVEHRDLNKTNNAWANLRKTDDSGNQANTRLRANSTSGFKSVNYRKDSRKWRARIAVRNKRIALGCFNTPKEAHAAYVVAAKKYHGKFARTY